MLDQIIHYLRSRDIPFRLSSHPSPEPLPEVAHPLPPGGMRVDVQVILVAGRAILAAVPHGAKVGFPGLTRELGVAVIEGFTSDLPPPYSRATGGIPPFGGAMGVPTFVDEAVTTAAVLTFTTFSPGDYLEIDYDDFARLEQPRVSAFAISGELTAGAPLAA